MLNVHRALPIALSALFLFLWAPPATAAQQAPITCGNLELTLTNPKLQPTDSAYDRLLRGHAYEFVDGERIDRSDAQREAIKSKMRTYLDGHDRPIIVIHFHGGLVDRCNGYLGAASLVAAYRSVDAFPIFPIYNVGMGESIDKGWSGMSARDPRYGGDGRAMSVTRRFWYGRGLLGEPVTDTRAIAIVPRLEKLAAERAVRFGGGRTHEDKYSAGTLTAREEQLRNGIYPGFNEGYMTGGRAWSYMKWVIDRSLAIDSNDHWTEKRQDAAMLALMDDIHELIVDHQKKTSRPTMIVLVSHSTGTIYAAKFMRAWKNAARDVWHDDAALKQPFSMLSMAPAVRYDDLYRALDEAGDMLQGRFRSFTMYVGAERDSYDGPAPGIRTRYYRLSLLYAISGLFEPWPDAPILGLQRFACPPFVSNDEYTTKPPRSGDQAVLYAFTPPRRDWYLKAPLPDIATVRLVHKWFSDNHVAHAFAYSPSPEKTPIGMQTTSIAHGEFPNDFATMSSVIALVKASWGVAPGAEDPWAAPGATNDSCATMLLGT